MHSFCFVGTPTAKQVSVRQAILSKPTATGQFKAGTLSGVSAQGTTVSSGAARSIPFQTVGGTATTAGKTQTIVPNAQYLVAPASPALAGKIATSSVQAALKADPYASSNAFLDPFRQSYTTRVSRAYNTMPQGYNQTYLNDPKNWAVDNGVLVDLGSGGALRYDIGGGGGGGGEYGATTGDNTLLYVALAATGIAIMGGFK